MQGPVSKALSAGSLVAPPAALTISYVRFSEAISAGSRLAMYVPPTGWRKSMDLPE